MAFKKRIKGESRYLGLRDTYLIRLAADLDVIHIGCTDWPFTRVNKENGSLLHLKLEKICGTLIGVDIDLVGLKYLETLIPGRYLHADLLGDNISSAFLQSNVDLILVPDVLEHVPNQRDFLKGCLDLAKSLNAELVFTTPNQYSIKAILGILVGLDFTHSDHRVVHNRVTLETSFADLGISQEEVVIDYVSRDIRERYGIVLSILSKGIDKLLFMQPYLADSLVVSIRSSPAS
jgi:hypothetical protein